MKAVTIGGAMLDSIAIIPSDRIERMVMRNADSSFLLLEEGRKTEAEEISTHCGGGAVNAAVAMARLGLDVSSVVRLGQDSRADQILACLSAHGISTRWIRRVAEAPTGASVIIAAHDRDAGIFTFRGANTLLKASELKDDMFSADLVYIASLSNESADCFPDLVKRGKKQGATVATNPGIRQLTTKAGSFHECLPSIDILSINTLEADALVPRLVAQYGEGGPALPLKRGEQPPALVARGLFSGGFEMTLAGFFNALLDTGVSHVVVTAGPEGAFLASQDGIRHCPTIPAEIHGTAGAGDAFAATFSALITVGEPVEQALLSAIVNAASVVGYADTQSGLLKRKELDKRRKKIDVSKHIRLWKL